jgi:hypothetical protein
MELAPLLQKEKQKYLILILIAVFLASAFVIYQGFIKEEKPSTTEIPYLPSQKIKIDFDFLKDSVLEQFKDYERIQSFEGEVGRENPFIPY